MTRRFHYSFLVCDLAETRRFFLDPSGNAIEIKAFRRDDEVFAR